jgi:hypothetical protein
MALLLLVAAPTLCSAEIYKWVDDRGQVGYADDLGKVPKKYRNSAVTTDKQEQAVEIVEKATPGPAPRKDLEKKSEPADSKSKDKEKPLFDGKDGDSWRKDFARQKQEIKTLEDHAVSIKERLADGSKLSRGEFLTLQNTQRDLDVRIAKARKKLDALTEAADRAELPAEFR